MDHFAIGSNFPPEGRVASGRTLVRSEADRMTLHFRLRELRVFVEFFVLVLNPALPVIPVEIFLQVRSILGSLFIWITIQPAFADFGRCYDRVRSVFSMVTRVLIR
jgi:hypothetical protein